jgi:hypothetical protein
MKGKHFVVFGFALMVLFTVIGCSSGTKTVGLEPQIVEDYFIKVSGYNANGKPININYPQYIGEHECAIKVDIKTPDAWYYSGLIPAYEYFDGEHPFEIDFYAIYDIKAGWLDFIYGRYYAPQGEPEYSYHERLSVKVSDYPKGVTIPVEITEETRSDALFLTDHMIDAVIENRLRTGVYNKDAAAAIVGINISSTFMYDAENRISNEGILSSYEGDFAVFFDNDIENWQDRRDFEFLYYYPQQKYSFRFYVGTPGHKDGYFGNIDIPLPIPLHLLRVITPVTQYIMDGGEEPKIPWIQKKDTKSPPKAVEKKKHTLF